MNDTGRRGDAGKLLQIRLQRRFITEDQETDIGMADKRDLGAAHNRFRSMVAAHAIQRNRQNSRHPFDPLSINRRRRTACAARAPKIQR